MWREYTREVPARPGLALLATSLALCGSLALAYSITNKSTNQDSQGTRRHLSQWPISFILPNSYVDVTLLNSPFDNLDGSSQCAYFQNPSGGEAVLVRYKLSDDEETSDQFHADTRDQQAGSHLIDMG